MPRVMTPRLAIRHLRRYRHVVAVLTKYGFGEIFGNIRLWGHLNLEQRVLHREHDLAMMTTPERLRHALEELGPTFVKLGQMLSTRPDLLPYNYIKELEKLQSNVAPIPASVARSIIEAELGEPINSVFSYFDDVPLAAASLAQVHRAVLNGEQVVVKVQRPNITEVIEVDLQIMHNLAVLMDRYLRASAAINPVGVVEEFAENIRRELDFRIEANSQRRFARNFSQTPWFHVPRLAGERCCTQRLIIMEYIDGVPISDVERLKSEGYDLDLVAQRGAYIGFRSALEFGFFQADPHPGNLFVLPGNNLAMIDFGMMGRLSNRDREGIGRLLYFTSSRDEKRTARALLSLIEPTEVLDAETLESAVSQTIQEFTEVSLAEIQLGAILFRFLRLLRENNARFPTHFIWLFKSLGTLEDVAHRLSAHFTMIDMARPYARRLFLKEISPYHQAREALFTSIDASYLLRDLPYDAGVILDQLKKGRVKIEFEHVGLDPLRRTFHQVTHHISLALMLSSLLIASSLIVLARTPPLLWEISVLGLVGFVFAAILVVILIFSMIWR